MVDSDGKIAYENSACKQGIEIVHGSDYRPELVIQSMRMSSAFAQYTSIETGGPWRHDTGQSRATRSESSTRSLHRTPLGSKLLSGLSVFSNAVLTVGCIR